MPNSASFSNIKCCLVKSSESSTNTSVAVRCGPKWSTALVLAGEEEGRTARCELAAGGSLAEGSAISTLLAAEVVIDGDLAPELTTPGTSEETADACRHCRTAEASECGSSRSTGARGCTASAPEDGSSRCPGVPGGCEASAPEDGSSRNPGSTFAHKATDLEDGGPRPAGLSLSQSTPNATDDLARDCRSPAAEE